MAMSIDKLLEAVKNTVITKEKVKALNKRLAAADKRFEEKEKRKAISAQDLLNFQCIL